MFDYVKLKDMGVNGSSHISNEISGQPALWEATYQKVLQERSALTLFLDIMKTAGLQIILSGAGSSAFIGQILQQAYANHSGKSVKAIPTTDLVTHPAGFFDKRTPTLLVSFARSGNSPESIATFELAEKLQDVVYHLIITCNADGDLAKQAAGKANAYVFLLPEGANDQALAMTGSFTSMTLAGLLIADIANIEKNEWIVKRLIESGSAVLNSFQAELHRIARLDFKRVVFLGSGSLKGVARESHLKLLEMTDGMISGQFDSFLGFRHGPRAGIDDSTLMVYLFSSDPYVYRYEADLVRSINKTEKFLYSIGIGQRVSDLGDLHLDLAIDMGGDNNLIPDDFFSVCCVVPAQLLGLYKSSALGLVPDSPSQKGGINRVVQGVTIYPF